MTEDEIKELQRECDELTEIVEIQAAVLKRMREKSLRWNQRVSHWYKQEETAYKKKHVKYCRVCGKVSHNQ
jgi:hypothetical protein